MYEFERLENGNVLLKKGGEVIRVFPFETYMSIDAHSNSTIILNNSNGNRNDADAYCVNADVVTVPSNTGRDDLINQLATNYFRPVETSIGSVTIEDRIPPKTVTVTNIANSTSEFLVSSLNVNKTETIVHNDSNTTVYIKYNTGVTSTNYTYKLFKQDSVIINDFHGDVYAIADNSNGFIMVTENILIP